jgi:HEAT repeat protein
LLSLGIFAAGVPDVAQLEEMLHDRQNAAGRSQAALVLVQSSDPAAGRVLRHGLQQLEDPDLFAVIAAAVRLEQDRRFVEDMLAALVSGRTAVRQAAAETLAALADAAVLERLGKMVGDCKLDIGVRQAALWAMGRSSRKAAVPTILKQLRSEDERLRQTAASALADLAGRQIGTEAVAWQKWWRNTRDISEQQWLERQVAQQSSRVRRLEGDLARARAQVLRLQQDLYARLTIHERPAHIQSLVEQDDPAVRLLAVQWTSELVSGADDARLKILTPVLLRLSNDSTGEVQRAAVLALGKVPDPAAFDRLLALMDSTSAPVRSAAARALAGQARGEDTAARQRRRRVVAALQHALADSADEVVVEAAEELGVLGVPEAGPVLTGLLRHPVDNIRTAAARALERVADGAILDRVVESLDDPNVAVRFSLVGAVARAAGESRALPAEQRHALERLEKMLCKDADAGVRSRAATVLGELGTTEFLQPLWDCVLCSQDTRVQEKAWWAFLEIHARAGSIDLLRQWDRTFAARRESQRRVQLVSETATRWQSQPEMKQATAAAQEMLIEVFLQERKWGSAAPVVRDLLSRPGNEKEIDRRLRWLLAIGEQALHDGNRSEALRAIQVARPYLPQSGPLAKDFARLEEASREP